MHDSDGPEPVSDRSRAVPVDGGDEQLDAFDADLESVAAALDAIDAEDLAGAEAIVERLSAVDPAENIG